MDIGAPLATNDVVMISGIVVEDFADEAVVLILGNRADYKMCVPKRILQHTGVSANDAAVLHAMRPSASLPPMER